MMHKHSQSGARPRGFTLVEILVVVVILGIIATVVGVSIGTRDDLKVQSSARVLMADLQYAQSRAIIRREPHYVVVGAGGVALSFCTWDASASKMVPITQPIEKDPFVMTFGNDGEGGGQGVVLISHDFNGNDVFGFDATGAPIFCDTSAANRVSASTVTSFTLGAGEFSMKILVQPITGEISIGN